MAGFQAGMAWHACWLWLQAGLWHGSWPHSWQPSHNSQALTEPFKAGTWLAWHGSMAAGSSSWQLAISPFTVTSLVLTGVVHAVTVACHACSMCTVTGGGWDGYFCLNKHE